MGYSGSLRLGVHKLQWLSPECSERPYPAPCRGGSLPGGRAGEDLRGALIEQARRSLGVLRCGTATLHRRCFVRVVVNCLWVLIA